MTFIDFILFLFYSLIALAGCLLSKYWYGDLVSPLSIFLGGNGLSLAFYHLKLIYLKPLSLTTHLIVLSGLMTFVVVTCLVSKIPFRPPLRPHSKTVATPGLSAFFYFTGFLATIGWILPLLLLIQKYTWGYLSQNWWLLQNEFQMQFIGYLNLLGILVLPTFTIKTLSSKIKLLDIIITLSALIGATLAGIKSYFIFSSAAALLAYTALRPDRLKFYHLGLALFVILAFFAFYDANIDIFVPKSFPGSVFPEQLEFLQRPYLYFVGSWPATEQILSGKMPPQPIWGYVTFRPLWKILGGLHIIQPVPIPLPAVNIGASWFNVYSFIGEVYWDYGLGGVWVFCALLGSIATSLYLKARQTAHWKNVLLYSLFTYGVVISFFLYYYMFEIFFLIGYVLFVQSFYRFKKLI